jgi:hypothetical protein
MYRLQLGRPKQVGWQMHMYNPVPLNVPRHVQLQRAYRQGMQAYQHLWLAAIHRC